MTSFAETRQSITEFVRVIDYSGIAFDAAANLHFDTDAINALAQDITESDDTELILIFIEWQSGQQAGVGRKVERQGYIDIQCLTRPNVPATRNDELLYTTICGLENKRVNGIQFTQFQSAQEIAPQGGFYEQRAYIPFTWEDRPK
ncbi:MAG: hypothetical protein OXP09_11920 [Gammaproteobacteria bacterium]|nr:hypothetical protein [Gammaproteobacteria bacterium]MDE0366268.1 hypothetical protein [Gammaproteobacteria bacterium]